MKMPLLIASLVLAVMVSALGVVYAKHYNRKLFVELTALQETRDKLNVEWGQLQLEQSTWATQGRIEKLARNKLKMTPVDYNKVIILEP
jgi:cell division protein FtsL